MESSALSEARPHFEELVTIVRRLLGEGKSTRSAGIKPILREKTGFDEAALGYLTFRGFLEGAQASGFVRLKPALRGPDVEVYPPETDVPEMGISRRRIRTDLWDAFVDWTPGFIRVYDRESGRAHRFSEIQTPRESAWLTDIRNAWLEDPDRFVSISHIPVETTLQWMREFTFDSTEGSNQERLLSALGASRPIRQFTLTVRALDLFLEWHSKRVQSLEEIIQKWAADHGLTIDIHGAVPGSAEPLFSSPSATAGPAPEELTTDELRELVRAALDRMPRADLLRIPLPLEFVIDRLR